MKKVLFAILEKPGGKPGLIALGVVAFLFVVGAIAWRTAGSMDIPGKTDPGNGGQSDFNDATWFPVQYFVEGGNPYSEAYKDYHPEGLGVSFYSPFTYLINSFNGLLPLETAQWINYLLIAGGLLILAWFSLRSAEGEKIGLAGVLISAALLAASRAGYGNLYSGQITILVALGIYIALKHAKQMPVLSGSALLLVSIKPNFLVPLGFLMLFRRDFRALVWGAIFSIAGAGLAICLIAVRGDGFGAFFQGIRDVYLKPGSHPEVAGVDEIGWLIVSPGSFLGHWLGGSSLIQLAVFVIVIGLAGFVIYSTKYRDHRLDSPAVLLVLLAVVLSVFHAAYDMMILAAPFLAILFGLGYWEKSDLRFRITMLLLLGIPMFNYLSTNLGKSILNPSEKIWQIICVSNAVLLSVAFLVLAVRMMRSNRRKA